MITAIQPDNQEQVDDLIATNRAAIRVQYHGVNNTKMKFTHTIGCLADYASLMLPTMLRDSLLQAA